MIKELSIIYQTNDLIAINKPSGLLVHPTEIDKHETQFAMKLLRQQIDQKVYPLHRLDKPTSGVLLFALNKKTASLFGTLFSEQKITKTYHAVVRGYTPNAATIDYPLKIKADSNVEKIRAKHKLPQQAITEYQSLARVELPVAIEGYPTSRYSLIECKPSTGRKHQIRRHLKHVHHPIIGDARYGRGRHNRFFFSQFNSNRLLLHASSVSFECPFSKLITKISAPIHCEMASTIEQLGWNLPF